MLGRAGSGLDNAIVGSFNSAFEFELFAGASRFATRAQARTAVPSGRHPVAGQHWLRRA
ncbi:hypothetical protein AB0C29_02265 [Actinoplanes sp. NPDC048791]|uniref:hypothetical protein n=1 Tax=Actinoplanes sp. NPDC048791 TaxID=3154623 RepID=UPI0033D781F5